LEERGFSPSVLGFIIGFSPVAGAFFDLLICKFCLKTDFRKYLLFMFVLCAAYPLILWSANTATLFLFAMAVWGLYFDLYGFSAFNFVGRHTSEAEHSKSFGIVQIFRSLGLIITPLLVGLVLTERVSWSIFSVSWIYLLAGFLFFIVLIFFSSKQPENKVLIQTRRRKSLLVELRL
jgi:fucose permease